MSENMSTEIFSTLEIDTIGEIMNISMGAAATAASTLLDNKVTITTPVVQVVPVEEFQISHLIPAIAVEIKYIEGIFGSNILILRQEDVRAILSQMMMTEIPPDFEIDEMSESAICELMNQMMGSSATVLSCFLGRSINISTPNTVPIDRLDDFKKEHFGESDAVVTITFSLSIKDHMESTFVSVMQIDLAKEIIGVSLNFNDMNVTEESSAVDSTQPELPNIGSGVAQATSVTPPSFAEKEPVPPAASAPVTPSAGPVTAQRPPAAPSVSVASQQQPTPPPAPEQPPYYPPYAQNPPYPYPPYPQGGYAYPPPENHAPIKVQEYSFGDFSQPLESRPEQSSNLDLIMDVPVVVTVELGRTKRKIGEILEFGQGSIVELDKQAGSQVDVIVNGQLIARGDVVVVDDNFSIRITEILKSRDSIKKL